VIVATDSPEIAQAVSSFGGRAVMTRADHPSGTDRIAEVAASLACDIIVNVQGDEPLIRPEMIDAVISMLAAGDAGMGTLAKRIQDHREVYDPNVVKVVFGVDGRAFYFSRAPIPFHRDIFTGTGSGTEAAAAGSLFMFKHIGIYSYRRDVLLELSRLEPTRLEFIERLEQLRALEHGVVIKVGETEFETIGVDTPEDLERIAQCLNSSS
jgi:3-deoxy-manno-octulosonate cytidylyltransferase (CMP-KDO synthetase)